MEELFKRPIPKDLIQRICDLKRNFPNQTQKSMLYFFKKETEAFGWRILLKKTHNIT